MLASTRIMSVIQLERMASKNGILASKLDSKASKSIAIKNYREACKALVNLSRIYLDMADDYQIRIKALENLESKHPKSVKHIKAKAKTRKHKAHSK